MSEPDFRNVLHIYHAEWWGIRSATEVCPGHRLQIFAERPSPPDAADAEINAKGIRYVFFQGYSENAGRMAEHIRRTLGRTVRIAVVTHVSVAQFDNHFEIRMLSLMLEQKRKGIIDGLFSVKAKFHYTCETFDELLLINDLPAFRLEPADSRIADAAFIPLARGLRKNMQANHIALCKSAFGTIFSSQESSDLMDLVEPGRVHYLGFIPPERIRTIMGRVGLVLNVTLIECQSMTFNEAISVGTPCLTGPVHLPFLVDHPLRKLTEVPEVDDVRAITNFAERIRTMWHQDADEVLEICRDYQIQTSRASRESYRTALSRLDRRSDA